MIKADFWIKVKKSWEKQKTYIPIEISRKYLQMKRGINAIYCICASHSDE